MWPVFAFEISQSRLDEHGEAVENLGQGEVWVGILSPLRGWTAEGGCPHMSISGNWGLLQLLQFDGLP
jgi:hypothetical protein